MKSAIVVTALWLGAAPAAAAADLVLELSTPPGPGLLAVAVHAGADSFRKGRGAARTLMVPRTGTATTIVVRDLPPGRYAVAAFQDADGDGELSVWPIGLPKEAYGFSRDARGRFGPPDFEAAAFDLPATGGRQAFRLR